MILQSTRFSEGPIRRPTSAAQFIDTHFLVTSLNQRSFSKQEREPWERGCIHESTISDIVRSLSTNYSKSVGVDMP